jgi:hypothetical protein
MFGADTSEADPGEFSAEKKDDVSIVRRIMVSASAV